MKSLDRGTRFNPALFLKIFLIYSLWRTSGWQFPSLLGQCYTGARLTVASRCRQVGQKRLPHVREQSDFQFTHFSPSSLLFHNAGLIAQRFSIHSFHVVTSPHIAGQMCQWEKHSLVKWSGRGSSCMPVQFSSLLLNLTCVCYGEHAEWL